MGNHSSTIGRVDDSFNRDINLRHRAHLSHRIETAILLLQLLCACVLRPHHQDPIWTDPTQLHNLTINAFLQHCSKIFDSNSNDACCLRCCCESISSAHTANGSLRELQQCLHQFRLSRDSSANPLRLAAYNQAFWSQPQSQHTRKIDSGYVSTIPWRSA